MWEKKFTASQIENAKERRRNMIITNRVCFSFKIPDESKEADKFRKDHQEAIEAYDSNYRSFVISNTYSIESKKGEKSANGM